MQSPSRPLDISFNTPPWACVDTRHHFEQFVEVCHSRTDRRIVGAGGVIEGESVLPGFRLPVLDLFKNWHSE